MYARAAAADAPTAPPVLPANDPEEAARIARELERAPPPASHTVYFQYGVAFASESVVAAGKMCSDLSKPCILGSGGGFVLRGGWRSSGSLYLGGAYEVTKMDPDKLYRMATLQQVRGEARYYFSTHRTAEPYILGSLGLSAYGNQWSIDTWGPNVSAGAGIEYQISQTTVIGLALGYRLMYFDRFLDTSGTSRAPSIAQLFGVDLILEQRASLLRTDDTK
jgi:hypothetical protein